jgi:drug/metabolite transporter (DMT)-like permease
MISNALFIVSLIILASLFDTITQLLLKTAINTLDLNINSFKKVLSFILKLLTIPKIWIGFIFCCLSLVVWLFVLSKADLNFAFSVDSIHYIFIAIASKFILKEKGGIKRWVGTAFIVLGIILLTFSNSN